MIINSFKTIFLVLLDAFLNGTEALCIFDLIMGQYLNKN